MAATAITPTVLTRGAFSAIPATSAVDATDGALVPYIYDDGKVLLIVENANASAAKIVTIKAGDGFQAGADLAYTVAAASKAVLCVESAPYLITTGTDKGKIKITGASADIKVAAVVLA